MPTNQVLVRHRVASAAPTWWIHADVVDLRCRLAPSSARRVELDIEGLPTVNVTGTDTSYRWVCDGDRTDKCRYDGPD
jgi:hypothetical protein